MHIDMSVILETHSIDAGSEIQKYRCAQLGISVARLLGISPTITNDGLEEVKHGTDKGKPDVTIMSVCMTNAVQ